MRLNLKCLACENELPNVIIRNQKLLNLLCFWKKSALGAKIMVKGQMGRFLITTDRVKLFNHLETLDFFNPPSGGDK